jgi:large subunit ribosomal protein L31
MKKNIHPTMRPTIFVDVSTKDEIITSSTITSKDTREVDGVIYQIVRTDITAHSHPFFTGEVRLLDERGTVERFNEKMRNAQARKEQEAAKASKKSQKQAKPTGDAKSYRDLLREGQETLRQNAKAEQPA